MRKIMLLKKLLISMAAMLVAGAPLLNATSLMVADGSESYVDTLKSASVSSPRGILVSRIDTIKINSSSTITDLLLSSPVLVVGDYGSVSGLKSVNLRGLGSAHTKIYIDGILVSNMQSGQMDLGLLDLQNFESVQIDYAQNSINFITRNLARSSSISDAYSNNNRIECNSSTANALLRAASFGDYRANLNASMRLTEGLYLGGSLRGLTYKGNYPYTGESFRENNDMNQYNGTLDLAWHSKSNSYLYAKAYFNHSRRGTPGSIAYPSTDRQNDQNFFFQSSYSKDFSSAYSLRAAVKYSDDKLDYISTWGNSNYREKAIQLNTTQYYRLNKSLGFSFVANYAHYNLASFYSAKRNEVQVMLGSKISIDSFQSNIVFEYKHTNNKEAKASDVFCPSMDFSYRVLDNLKVQGFAKRDYRIPTFNELYYPGFGNPELKAEDAFLSDLGLEYNLTICSKVKLFLKADAFYNALKNKIVSAPTQADPNIWLPFNVGKADIYGSDIQVGVNYNKKDCEIRLLAKYSYQDTKDSVPYLSKHSVVFSYGAKYKTWTADMVWNLRAGRLAAYGTMPNWNTVDLRVGKAFQIKSGTLKLDAFCNNLSDYRYELVSGYPMIGRNFGIVLNYNF